MKPLPPNHRKKKLVKVNAIAFAHMVDAMVDGDKTCREIAEACGLHYVTVLQYTRELHATGAAHIVAWEPDARGRYQTVIYKLGRGKDARRPKLTNAEKQERYQSKQRTLKMIQATAGEHHAKKNP